MFDVKKNKEIWLLFLKVIKYLRAPYYVTYKYDDMILFSVNLIVKIKRRIIVNILIDNYLINMLHIPNIPIL